ncbi:DUF6520 family protein [Flavivirga eckloniae]|uniref:Uncharacterized protein n=1 Tax=Flavivirga eckloniae TaxID=1803846 RepID=A0A2K9PNT4_9FLAO|nr:DUF6520 family protein [Flavivirga eckloniae]AUP78714.1 hypothetical protein C1H87_08335 [Flavivirga eckloniae]
MKNLFKIALPALALMLAITASLAFTTNASDEAPQDAYYIDTTNNNLCTLITLDDITEIPDCKTINDGEICTTFVFGLGTVSLYDTDDCATIPDNLLKKPKNP